MNDTTVPKKKQLTIPLELTESQHLLCTLSINGKPARLLVDTGASNSCIAVSKRNDFNLTQEAEELPLTAAGKEKIKAYNTTESTLKFEVHALGTVNFILIDMGTINDALEENGSVSIDGILGADVLIANNAKINYKKLSLKLDSKGDQN